MKNKRVTSLLMALITVASMAMPVSAAEMESIQTDANELEVSTDLVMPDITEYETIEVDELPVLEKSEISEEIQRKLESSLMRSSNTTFAASAGDQYEPNNTPATATTGRYNRVTYATIDSATDWDWYKFECLNTSTPMAFILTNIPSACDYDMYIVKYDSTNGITEMYYNLQSGAASEELYGYLPSVGTYYVYIEADGNYSANNFSDYNYKLYFGDYYRTGSYGYESTGISANFGYHPTGTTSTTSLGYYSYDLRNVTSIPDGAIVDQYFLTADGNGAYWAGFYKVLLAGSQGYSYTKLGNIPMQYSSAVDTPALAVKQMWYIGGYLNVSYSFIWEPKVLITYQYPMSIANLRFIG